MRIFIIIGILLKVVFANEIIIDANGQKYQLIPNNLSEDYKTKLLHSINKIRKKLGLVEFKYDKELEKAALLHANYIFTTKKEGHYENKISYPFFGETPEDRIKFIKYPTKMIGEEVSTKDNVIGSIVSLLNVPYHRLGFLKPDFDLLGIATIKASNRKTITVVEMSNSYIKYLCKNNGTFYPSNNKNICYTYNPLSIQKKILLRNVLRKKFFKVPYVLYPFNNQKNLNTVISKEKPSPFKNVNQKMSGNAITLTFAPFLHVNVHNINCKLFNENKNQEVKMFKLTKDNDINDKTPKNAIIYLPYKRLEFGTKYKIVCQYENKSFITSYFRTVDIKSKLLDLEKIGNNEVIYIKTGTSVFVYAGKHILIGLILKTNIPKQFIFFKYFVLEYGYFIKSIKPGKIFLKIKYENGETKSLTIIYY